MEIQDNRENKINSLDNILEILKNQDNISKIRIYDTFVSFDNKIVDSIFLSIEDIKEIDRLKYFKKEIKRNKEKIKYIKLIKKEVK